MTEIVLDGKSLTFEQVVEIAYGKPGRPSVSLSEEAKAGVNRAAQAVDFRKKKIGPEKRLGNGTRGMCDAIRAEVPFIESDCYMKDYLDAVRKIVDRFEV